MAELFSFNAQHANHIDPLKEKWMLTLEELLQASSYELEYLTEPRQSELLLQTQREALRTIAKQAWLCGYAANLEYLTDGELCQHTMAAIDVATYLILDFGRRDIFVTTQVGRHLLEITGKPKDMDSEAALRYFNRLWSTVVEPILCNQENATWGRFWVPRYE